MSNLIGLYYPFTEFKDDAWVKFAALYWDKLGRIVPDGYQPHDSETVQQLIDELDFIKDFEPFYNDKLVVEKMFFDMLDEHEEDLVELYGVAGLYMSEAREDVDVTAQVRLGLAKSRETQ